MTNYDFIKEFVKGEKDYNANGHLIYFNNELVNYSTTLCIIDRAQKTAKLNTRKYSRTTSKIQSLIRSALEYYYFTIEDYYGETAKWWNCGYMGAENWTRKEAQEIYERNIG